MNSNSQRTYLIIVSILLIASVLLNALQFQKLKNVSNFSHTFNCQSSNKQLEIDNLKYELRNYKALYEVAKETFEKDTCFNKP
ncbi:MAG: hypothetical protein JNL75_06105 [Chitinophagales bacterium]|nr:hypothetical protein [Chitinophagales bacterium]